MKFFYAILTFLSLSATAAHAQSETETICSKREKAWQQSLFKNVDSSVAAKNGAPAGRYTVVIQFVADTNGEVSDVKALTSFGYGMEEAVIRAFRKAPFWEPAGSWQPAKQSNRPIKAYCKQFFTFVVNNPAVTVATTVPYTLFTNTDNSVFISVRNVKPNKMRLLLQDGMINKASDGSYIIRTDKPGSLSLKVFKGKRNKQVAEVIFEVQSGPIL